MAKLNYKNSLIKKLQYRSIYSGSKECDFVLSNFAKNNLEKLKNNIWYIENEYTLSDLNSSDHAEVIDYTMANK